MWVEPNPTHSNPEWVELYCEFSKVQFNSLLRVKFELIFDVNSNSALINVVIFIIISWITFNIWCLYSKHNDRFDSSFYYLLYFFIVTLIKRSSVKFHTLNDYFSYSTLR
jgi:hypothetical protein